MATSRDIKYLVLSGGGAAGVAYAGAIDELANTPGFSLDNVAGVAGTSVGALVALGIGLNHSAAELYQLINGLDLKKFEDGGSLPSELYGIYNKLGWYKSDALFDYIKSLIQAKTGRDDPENVTFADLHALGCKDLHVITTKMRLINKNANCKEKVFCYEKTPDTSVAAAVLASVSAPLYFPFVRLKKEAKGKYVLTQGEDGDAYCDGGLMNNYPIEYFDKRKYVDKDSPHGDDHAVNPRTLGLALLDKRKIVDKSHKPVKKQIANDHPIEVVEAIFNAFANKYENESLNKADNRERTIQIDRLGVSLGKFDMSNKTREALVQSGGKAVRQYFKGNDETFGSHQSMWEKPVVTRKEKQTKRKRCVVM